MRILRRLFVAGLTGIVVVGLGAACARAGGGSTPGSGPGSGEPDQTATQTARVAVAVTVTRTGGFAGVNQMIAVAPDGTWVYSDARNAQSTERGTLTPSQRLELARLATTPELFTQLAVTPNPLQCADAFNFAINIDGKSANFSECGRHPQPAVDALMAFLTDSTPF